jgi:predicted DNA-binding protein
MQIVTSQHRSPFKAGNAIGRNTINRTINLTDEADELLASLARRTGKSVSEFVRETLAAGIEVADKTAAHSFRVAQRLTMIFFVFSIPALSFSEGDEFEARRPRRSGMCARVCAHPARKPQVAA